MTASLGQLARDPAAASFHRGFELALLLAAAITGAAGLLGYLGLRRRSEPRSA